MWHPWTGLFSLGDRLRLILDWTLATLGLVSHDISTGDIFLAGTAVMAIRTIAVKKPTREKKHNS